MSATGETEEVEARDPFGAIALYTVSHAIDVVAYILRHAEEQLSPDDFEEFVQEVFNDWGCEEFILRDRKLVAQLIQHAKAL